MALMVVACDMPGRSPFWNPRVAKNSEMDEKVLTGCPTTTRRCKCMYLNEREAECFSWGSAHSQTMLRLIYFVNTLEIFRSLPSQAACDVITSLLDMAAISHTCEAAMWLLQSTKRFAMAVIVAICCKFISRQFRLSCCVSVAAAKT